MDKRVTLLDVAEADTVLAFSFFTNFKLEIARKTNPTAAIRRTPKTCINSLQGQNHRLHNNVSSFSKTNDQAAFGA